LLIPHSNEAKIKAYGYGSFLIAIFVVGLIVANMLMFGYMLKHFDQVRLSLNCVIIVENVEYHYLN